MLQQITILLVELTDLAKSVKYQCSLLIGIKSFCPYIDPKFGGAAYTRVQFSQYFMVIKMFVNNDKSRNHTCDELPKLYFSRGYLLYLCLGNTIIMQVIYSITVSYC